MTQQYAAKSENYGYQPTHRKSFLDKMTNKDRGLAVIGFLFLFTGPPFIVSIILFFVVISRVSSREQSKVRIVNVLNNTPETNIEYLKQNLDKSFKHVDETLKIMILDEGYPIRYDLVNKSVKLVHSKPQAQTVPVEFDQPAPVQQTQPVVDNHSIAEPQAAQVVSSVQPVAAPKSSCIQCGTGLPIKAKYCNNCGVRQFS